MVNLDTLVSQLENSVRLQQRVNPDVPALDSSLTDPATARLVYHALLEAENIYGAAPDFASYKPEPSPTLSNLFSDWLAKLRQESVRKAVMEVVNNKKKKHIQRDQLSNLALYEGQGSFSDLNIAQGRLVGFEIILLNNNGLFVDIPAIALQLSQPQTLAIHIYNSELKQRLSTQDLVYGLTSGTQWITPGTQIKFVHRDVANDLVGGTYYIMYDEDDLTGQSINKRHTFDRRPCGSCSRYNIQAWEKYSQYFNIRAIWVGATKKPADPAEMFDTKDINYMASQNWGMNLIVNSGCDVTQFFVDRSSEFSDVIARQYAVDLLLAIANSTRSNVLSEKIRDGARAALRSRDVGGEGIIDDLHASYEGLALELSDTERNVCAPRARARHIRHTSVRTR
jgi:hypothetical protein